MQGSCVSCWVAYTLGWLLVWLIETGGGMTRRPERSLRCLLAEATWQIYEQNCKKIADYAVKMGCWAPQTPYTFRRNTVQQV